MRRMENFCTAALAGLLLLAAAPAQAAAPGAEALGRLLADYAPHATLPLPELTPAELEELANGEAIIRLNGTADDDDEVSAMGIVGVRLLEAPRLLLWLSVLGGNDERDWRLTPATLARGERGAYVRYQHIDLPWPVRDRHWVIQCEKNLALAAASNDRAWEHYWSLHDEGPELLYAAHAAGGIPRLSRDDLDDSIFLPANRGAWGLIDAGEQHTLVVAFLDAHLGGAFPDRLVRGFTKRRLRAGFERLADMATRVHESYDGTPAIHDGQGAAIPAEAAARAAARWRERLQLAAAGQAAPASR